MRTAGYTSGGTNTAGAITAIYTTDLPTSRNLPIEKTIVFVFTDGRSNSPSATTLAAAELQKNATVFSFAIGTNINADELNAIATSGQYTQIKDF